MMRPCGRALALDVVAGEVEVLREGLLPGDRTGPVLAQQSALVEALTRVAAVEAGAVAGGEDDGRGGVAAEQAREGPLGGVGALVAADLPVGQRGDEEVGERATRLVALSWVAGSSVLATANMASSRASCRPPVSAATTLRA
jgi:hypothetical protein